jgi:hypothetical protein
MLPQNANQLLTSVVFTYNISMNVYFITLQYILTSFPNYIFNIGRETVLPFVFTLYAL